MNRVYNFNAGPATIPLEVLEEVKEKFMNFGGMSVLEISHRSKEFSEIIENAQASVKKLMNVPDDYDVLFLQGGAAYQFAMIPLNFLKKSADYVVTGHWSQRALNEAKILGTPRVIYSSEENDFTKVPTVDELNFDETADYAHITSNNTIYGTQFKNFPKTQTVPLVADMSSDIMSRQVNVSDFSIIYAGAQKNLGPAGVALIIIKKDMLAKCKENLPKIMKYSTHAEKKSLFNTPPVFSIYVLNEVLNWLAKQGGVSGISKINEEKAGLIYKAIDESDLYLSKVEKDSRSNMNITMTLKDESLTEKFIASAKENGFIGLKGHRLVGGIRASVYNAFPLEGAKAFAEFMKDFERRT